MHLLTSSSQNVNSDKLNPIMAEWVHEIAEISGCVCVCVSYMLALARTLVGSCAEMMK